MDAPKLDSSLLLAYRAWLAEDAERDPDRTVSVIVRFENDARGLEDAGFTVAAVMEDEVVGMVRYADLERLSSHANVVWIAAGSEKHPTLDISARDILARASSTGTIGGAGGDGLWHVDSATGALTATGGATGTGVVVAVIDTGIDISHPMFHNSIKPPSYDTRILRIWDQGLTPTGAERGPDPALLISSVSYGVEYQKPAIDTALNSSGFPHSPLAFPHRDCLGHGTHVASTAAGGTTFSTGADASRVGVAPRADIVAVKLLDTPRVIRDANGNEVMFNVRFRDAVMYCLRVARAAAPLGLGDKPVVINCSFGSRNEAGDGLDPDDVFLNRTFDPTAAADATHFPRRAILVKAAGNDGDRLGRQHAKITVPDSGQIDVPFELFDNRGASRNKFVNCASVPFVPKLEVNCWARRIPAPNDMSVAARVPTEAGFSERVFAGLLEKPFDGGKLRRIRQTHVPVVQRPTPPAGTVAVRRNHILLQVEPNARVSPPQHAEGIYDLRFHGPPGTVIHALCDQHSLAAGRMGFRVATHYRPNPPLPDTLPDAQTIAGVPGIEPIEVTGSSTIVDSSARNTITVAAYDPRLLVVGPPTRHHIAPFSSRGPLRDFTDPPLGPLSTKPDISAPGISISAARSKDMEAMLIPVPTVDVLRGNRFAGLLGTSMAAPMITGVIALMLEKNPDLSVDDVRAVFTAAGNTRVGLNPPAGDPLAPGAYGAGMVNALKSHIGTPP